ncbi:hypothetical protein [Kitasatospora sp. HPMI-4]
MSPDLAFFVFFAGSAATSGWTLLAIAARRLLTDPHRPERKSHDA